MTDYPDVPNLDEARQRLVRRFGESVQSWLEELTGRLLVLRERWGLELDSVLPKGSMSVVIPCRTALGGWAISLSDIAPALIDCARCLGGHFLDSLDCICAFLLVRPVTREPSPRT